MPVFAKPSFNYDYTLATEIAALRKRRTSEPSRAILPKSNDSLLLATWNIANLGAQDRRDKDHALLAAIISWFNLVALQEVRNNLAELQGVMKHLPASWAVLYSAAAGNNERMVFVYDSRRGATRHASKKKRSRFRLRVNDSSGRLQSPGPHPGAPWGAQNFRLTFV